MHEDKAAPAAGPPRGRGARGGRVVRSLGQEEAAAPAAAQDREQGWARAKGQGEEHAKRADRLVMAHPAPEATAAPSRARFGGRAGGTGESAGIEANAAEESEEVCDAQRQPSVADVSAGVRMRLEAQAANAALLGRPTGTPPAAPDRTALLRTQLAAIWEATLGKEVNPQTPTSAASAPADGKVPTLQLRVLLLPPERSTEQPARDATP